MLCHDLPSMIYGLLLSDNTQYFFSYHVWCHNFFLIQYTNCVLILSVNASTFLRLELSSWFHKLFSQVLFFIVFIVAFFCWVSFVTYQLGLKGFVVVLYFKKRNRNPLQKTRIPCMDCFLLLCCWSVSRVLFSFPFLWCCQIGHSFASATATTVSRILHANPCKGILRILLQDINHFLTYLSSIFMFSSLPTGHIVLYFPQDPKLLQALVENSKRSGPYAGAFLVKDDEGTNPNAVTNSESDNSIHDLKGKELLKRLHDVGTLAQVLSSFENLVVSIFCSVDFEMRFPLLL